MASEETGEDETAHLQEPVVGVLDDRQHPQVASGEALHDSRTLCHRRRESRVLLSGDHEGGNVGREGREAGGLLFGVVDAARAVPVERVVQAIALERVEVVLVLLRGRGESLLQTSGPKEEQGAQGPSAQAWPSHSVSPSSYGRCSSPSRPRAPGTAATPVPPR